MTGIAARDKDRVDSRQLPEHVIPGRQCRLHDVGITIIAFDRRIPDTHVEAILVEEPRQGDHHLHGRAREVRAVGRIVRPGRDQFHDVGAEDRQVADGLLPLGDVPAVIGVGLGAIAHLVAADRIARGTGDLEGRGEPDAIALHAQLAQQSSDAEEHTARVIAQHDDGGPMFLRPDPESLGSTRNRGGLRHPGQPGSHRRDGSHRTDQDHGAGRPLGPARADFPIQAAPPRHFLDQHGDGLSLWPREARRRHDHGPAQVEPCWLAVRRSRDCVQRPAQRDQANPEDHPGTAASEPRRGDRLRGVHHGTFPTYRE